MQKKKKHGNRFAAADPTSFRGISFETRNGKLKKLTMKVRLEASTLHVN